MSQGTLFRPLSDRVVVRLEEEGESVTKGGIVLPETAEKGAIVKGKVVAVGPGRWSDHVGGLAPMSVYEGEEIYIQSYSGFDIEISGETFRVVRDSEVVGTLEPADSP